jgi:uncharacterized protein YbjT (DUF2867 family)
MNKLFRPLRVLVAGITGNQGGSVAKYLKQAGFHVIGLTRNIHKGKSKKLIAQGFDLREGNLNYPESLIHLASEIDYAFFVTDFWVGKESEILHGINFINAFKTCKHIVFSSTPTSIWKNTFAHSDSKFEIEKYLKSQTKNYTIIRPGFYMEIFQQLSFCPPMILGMMKKNIGTDSKLPFVSIDDIGKALVDIFNKPQAFGGKELNIFGDQLTLDELLAHFKTIKGRNPWSFSIPNWLFKKLVSTDLVVMWQWFGNNQFNFDKHDLPNKHITFKDWLQTKKVLI